jgi:hypothetical protein
MMSGLRVSLHVLRLLDGRQKTAAQLQCPNPAIWEPVKWSFCQFPAAKFPASCFPLVTHVVGATARQNCLVIRYSRDIRYR